MIISLFFVSGTNPELAEIVFSPQQKDVRVARRGKGLVYSDDQASFQWTKAVKAFALLVVGSKVARLSDTPFELKGEQGSTAASLDFAISKPTDWIAGLFGGKEEGRDFRRAVFKISNSEQKLPGPVSVHLSASFDELDSIQVYLDERQLLKAQELLNLYLALGGDPFPTVDTTTALTERVLSMQSAPPSVTGDNFVPWFARESFLNVVFKDISRAIGETHVMESLGIEQAETRLQKIRSASQFRALAPVFRQLKQLIPPEHQRYESGESFPLLAKRKESIRIGCPPMAMSSLLLFRSLGLDFDVPVEIFSHHQSSSAILSTIEEHQLDYVVLSWGAVEKMRFSGEGAASRAIMMLPRTSIDLVVPKTNEHFEHDPLNIYVSTDEAGYPYQYFASLKEGEGAPWSGAHAINTNIVEIIARLTKAAGSAIVSFPFSGVLTLNFDYKVFSPTKDHPVRFGDNILLGIGGSKGAGSVDQELQTAMRSAWYRMLEDSQFLERSVRALLSDTQYIKSLKRLGGLYRV